MEKIDYKKVLKHLYKPSKAKISVVDVPAMKFAMIDGEGNPNTSELFQKAVEALYGISYTLKFMVKNSDLGFDYVVMPLEGLWWADDMTAFSVEKKDDWFWTLMIMHPEQITPDIFEEARAETKRKKKLEMIDSVRFDTYHEGQAAQILYIGPFADEGPTIQNIHDFIDEQGGKRDGKHHEIYLSDPRRTAPEKLKTVIRQPFRIEE